MNDMQRAAIIALVSSAFPVLQLAGILSLTSDEIAAVMLMITNGMTVLALFVKVGQEQGPSV